MRHFSLKDHFADPYVALYMGVVLVMAAVMNNFLLAACCDGFTAVVGFLLPPARASTAPSLIPTLNGNTVRSFSTHGQQSAAQGSSTTLSRSDIR
jgi:hypothetical protein